MILNIDVMRGLLRSVSERLPLPAELQREPSLDAHRKLLLEANFAEGGAYSRDSHLVANKRPFRWEYSLWSLSTIGEQFLAMAANDDVWKCVMAGYEARDCEWSMAQLYAYLEAAFKESEERKRTFAGV